MSSFVKSKPRVESESREFGESAPADQQGLQEAVLVERDGQVGEDRQEYNHTRRGPVQTGDELVEQRQRVRHESVIGGQLEQ